MYRIGFDGTPLLGPKTGVGWYTHELIDAVARRAPEDELLVFPISWRTARMLRLDPPHRPNVSVTRKIAPARPLWAMWDRVAFPPMEWLVDCDVFHATNFIAPPSLRVPTVVTVHDIGFIRQPESVPPAIRRMARLLPAVLRRAAVVVTVSEFTRDELVWWLPDIADRIVVIHNGSHHRASMPSSTGLPPGPPYALMIGTLEPRKNVGMALDAMRILRHRDLDIRLVLAGSPSPVFDMAGELAKRDLGPPEVVQTGYVDDARVAALVAGASMLVFPSLYEGFGMPVLEAMESGLPVVATRAGATPEIAAGAAVLVDPGDAEGFADAIRRVATDDELRARMIAAGLRRATDFSWDKAAKATIRLYHSLAG